MKKSVLILPLVIGVIWSSSAFSINQEQIEHEKSLSQLAKSNCSSEKIEGEDYKVTVLADGDVEVSFFGKKGGGIKGTFKYTKSEWEGRQRVLIQHQAKDNERYTNCINKELLWLRKSYQPPAAHSKIDVGCPGNILDGEHIPRGHAKWFWNLDMSTGVAKIQKSKSGVTGDVVMSCSKNRWSATLSNMSHGLSYKCNGAVDGNKIAGGTCTPSKGGIIDVTGKFSWSN